MNDTHKSANKGFTADEKAAMRERARELKAESKSRGAREEGERDLLAKIAEMVRSYGGVLKAHSDGPDRGATFTVDLPRNGAADAPSPERENDPQGFDRAA